MNARKTDNPFGKKLRELRRTHNKTLVDLADAAGYSVVHISDIERGKRSPPPPEKILLMLKELGEVEQYDNLVDLASRSRDSVDISLKGESTETKNMLLALARKCEDGDVDDDLAKAILNLLKKDMHK